MEGQNPMEGFITINDYGNEELRVSDPYGGHVTIVKNEEGIRHFSGELGFVSSFTEDNIGGTEHIYTKEDIDKCIAGIQRINRITHGDKEMLIDYLKTFYSLI